jgi:hypothetical protein
MSALKEIENRSEFFKKGSIVPKRVLKAPTKISHQVTFNADVFVIPGPYGYVVFTKERLKNSESMVFIETKGWSDKKTLVLQGSPYFKKGDTVWTDRLEGESDECFAQKIKKYIWP